MLLNKFRILLSVGDLADADLLLLAASIATLAPQSPLITVPAIAASVAALTTKAAALKAGGEGVKTAEDQLQNAKSTASGARVAIESEVGSLMGLVTNNAKTASDVTSMAFKVRTPASTATAAASVLPPASIGIRMSRKARGALTAAAQDVGNASWHYAAESSPDPVGASTWSALPGVGRSRKVTGASGTKVWVRFARVRGQIQSDWSTPVLVTIP